MFLRFVFLVWSFEWFLLSFLFRKRAFCTNCKKFSSKFQNRAGFACFSTSPALAEVIERPLFDFRVKQQRRLPVDVFVLAVSSEAFERESISADDNVFSSWFEGN